MRPISYPRSCARCGLPPSLTFAGVCAWFALPPPPQAMPMRCPSCCLRGGRVGRVGGGGWFSFFPRVCPWRGGVVWAVAGARCVVVGGVGPAARARKQSRCLLDWRGWCLVARSNGAKEPCSSATARDSNGPPLARANCRRERASYSSHDSRSRCTGKNALPATTTRWPKPSSTTNFRPASLWKRRSYRCSASSESGCCPAAPNGLQSGCGARCAALREADCRRSSAEAAIRSRISRGRAAHAIFWTAARFEAAASCERVPGRNSHSHGRSFRPLAAGQCA